MKADAIKILSKAESVLVEPELREKAAELKNFIAWTGIRIEMLLDGEEAKTIGSAVNMSQQLLEAADPEGVGV